MTDRAVVDDDDDSAMWRAYKEASQQKRASNREGSATILKVAGVEFVEKNMGAHLQVKHEGRVIDFWPGTGLWIDKSHPFSTIKGRGVRKLMRHIGK